MSVRFKFRSSANFDSININGHPSISIRNLRLRIIQQLNLKICHDFELVITDANTAQVFEDEEFLVESGSSVIIKRVPTGRSSVLPHVDVIDNLGKKRADMAHTFEASPYENVVLENFDDFGIDPYPSLGESLLDSDPDVDKMNCVSIDKAHNEVSRCSQPSIVRCHNLEPSDLSEAIERGTMHFDIEEDTSEIKLEQKKEGHKDIAKNASSPALSKYDLPSELKCSLCNMIFKDAMMIPCCQHSFCEKCIRVVLVEKESCPKCFSSKCGIKDLLPNVSLRQAIDHFLETELLLSGSDNILPKYAPDGESGIHMKEFSSAVSIHPREPLLPHSPSVTGKGSNQVMTNFKGAPEKKKPVAEFQGESQPVKRPPTVPKEEASSTARKWVNTADEPGWFTGMSKHRKGERTCYMCGSPDHFIRDCPAASSPYPNPYPMLQSGDPVFPGGMSAYAPPYWHGASLPHMRPYSNMYATPGIMPYDPTMVPVTPPFGVSYMPSMYAGISVPCGVMRMGGLMPPASMMSEAERPVSRAELMELQESEQRYKFLSEHQHREKLREAYEDYSYKESQKSHDRQSQFDREKRASYSEESDSQRSRKKHSRDRRPDDLGHEKSSRSSHHYEVTSSEMQATSDGSDHYSKERHKHHRKSSKKHDDTSKRSSNHPSHKEVISDRKKIEIDVKKHSGRYHDHSDSGLEPKSSGDRKQHRKEKESSHSSRHYSKHKVKSAENESDHGRWQMGHGLEEAHGAEESHNHHKRKRRH
ncbi:hypothetical protein GIB67_035562 [Kingdonia uniflora]|uniref:Uncharacterized protein n=1 Tax=Kingdonia uniflora TaxID=39325 RepID=A0A7J7LD40_9MAGN|nr:hypothetical protein GIB67_035562 [Kingdonia uniflora]